MPLIEHITSRTSQPVAKTRRFRVIRELLIWNDARREYHCLQKLDRDALRDMGLTEAGRASVTVSQIAARMRG